MTPPDAHADDVAALRAPVTLGINSLFYAPDGQTLWSVDDAGRLVIRARDGITELYRGTIAPGVDGLHILRDSSFIFYINSSSTCRRRLMEASSSKPRSSSWLIQRRVPNEPARDQLRLGARDALKQTRRNRQREPAA